MPASISATLDVPIEGLHATAPARLIYQPDVLVRSFLLKRPAGNVLIYNAPGLTPAAPAIQALGGASKLLLNHSHEAMYGPPAFSVPASVHERDREETARTLPVAATWTRREQLGPDLDIIPTPGHTAGTTSFLWDDGRHRFLFTGDFIWIDRGQWKVVVLDDRLRTDYLHSLAVVRDLDFDVLVPWGAVEGGPVITVVTQAERHARLDAIIARVSAGHTR